MRAFLAIELTPEVRAALAELVEQLGRANLRGLRLVRPESIHLTLKFLGEAPEGQVDAIVAAVAGVAEVHTPFVLQMGGVGVFPNRSNPRVLWVGVEGELTSLLSLQKGIEDSVAPLGFARERRSFDPHLTIARVRDGTPTADRRRAAEALFSAGSMPGLRIDVDAVSLMRSTLLPDGAVYERVADMPLSGCGKRGVQRGEAPLPGV